MTLLPCVRSEITVPIGVVTIELEPETVCAHPQCAIRYGLQTHHVVRRSETGGPVRWVIVNGVLLLNERRLCQIHHAMVTGEIGGHRAWIRYLEGHGWVWYAPAPLGGPDAVLDKLGSAWIPVDSLKAVM